MNTIENDEEFTVCPFCSEKIKATAIKCRHCGEILDKELAEARNKPRMNFQQWQAMQKSDKSRGVYIILGLVGGLLGFHNFYAGYHKKATFQLIMTLTGFLAIVTLIWVLSDLISVKEDGQGKEFK